MLTASFFTALATNVSRVTSIALAAQRPATAASNFELLRIAFSLEVVSERVQVVLSAEVDWSRTGKDGV
jgi:hypothetical protein